MWWQSAGALDRFVIDLVRGELERLRPGRPAPALTPASRFDPEDVGLDSLELLNVATALAEAVQLGRSGLGDSLLARRSVAEWSRICAQGLERFSDEMVFHTSGSTGPAKSCAHLLSDLGREIAVLASIVGAPGRILTAVPSHHIYGFLFTVLLPAHLGLPVTDVRAAGPWALGRLCVADDLVVGHPAFWALVCRANQSLPAITAVSSAGRLDAATEAELTRLGAARVLEIYGSGETAGMGWRQSPDPAFRLFPYWRRCGDGIESETRAVPVPDRLEWLDDRRFTVVGRLDGGVKVGGTIVHPERVRARLLEHPQVQDAAVRPAKFGDIWRLKAFIVPTAGHDPATLAEDMHRFVETSLTAPERPRSFTVGPALPHNAQGKPADWG